MSAGRLVGVLRSRCAVAAACAALFVVLLALVASSWSPLLSADRSAARHFYRFASSHPPVADIAKVVSNVGQPVVFEVLAGVLVLVAVLRRRFASGLALAGAVLAELALGHLIKVWVGRPRPHVAVPIAHATGASFPSSHTLAATTVVTAVLLLPEVRRRIAAVGVVLGVVAVVTVGLSRLVLVVHYPSDVVGGWLLGVALAFAASALAAGLPRRQFAGRRSGRVRGTALR